MSRFLSLLFFVALIAGGLYAGRSYLARLNPFDRDGRVSGDEIAFPPAPATYESGAAPGNFAPDFRLPSNSGEAIRLGDFLGHPVVLTFWDTRCAFCARQLAEIGAAARRSGSFPVFLAINRGDVAADAEAFATATAVPPQVRVLSDTDEAVAARYRAERLPMTYFIGPDGAIYHVVEGEVSADTILTTLVELGS